VLLVGCTSSTRRYAAAAFVPPSTPPSLNGRRPIGRRHESVMQLLTHSAGRGRAMGSTVQSVPAPGWPVAAAPPLLGAPLSRLFVADRSRIESPLHCCRYCWSGLGWHLTSALDLLHCADC